MITFWAFATIFFVGIYEGFEEEFFDDINYIRMYFFISTPSIITFVVLYFNPSLEPLRFLLYSQILIITLMVLRALSLFLRKKMK